MKIAILYKKCSIENKINLVYFNSSAASCLLDTAAGFSQLSMVFWLNKGYGYLYSDLNIRSLINHGFTLAEYKKRPSQFEYLKCGSMLKKESIKIVKSLNISYEHCYNI